MAVDVIFHKAVDPTVITQPAVTLTSEMDTVYGGDTPPLEDINRQRLNLGEIYEHNGSGWVFSHFASLQLTVWHLDHIRASAFVPLPRWIRELCDEYIATPKTMIFSTEDSLSFTNATTCHICTKPLADDDRVRDHCHWDLPRCCA